VTSHAKLDLAVQVAQALREKCQRYLAGQLPNNQADVAQAAGIVPSSNESTVSPTIDMQVDNDSQVAGTLLLKAALVDQVLVCFAQLLCKP